MQSQFLRFAFFAAFAGAAFAQVPPTGFQDESFWTGLSTPTGMALMPDGRMVICEQFSAAVKIRSTTGAVATMGTVPSVTTGSERGLLSVCVDPQFPTRPYVYTWYSKSGPANMVLSMWTVSGAGLNDPTSAAVTIGSQYFIINDSPDGAFNHNGGTIRFGPDGFLYLSIGDDASVCNAQNFDVLAGCMLRLNVANLPGVGVGPPAKSTLFPPAGNPWNFGTDNRKLHWAKGLRNPFRFHIDAPTGELFIADVGQNAWEEISRGMPAGGENFGWPWWEGNASYQPASCGGQGGTVVTAPIATISHASTSAGSIISMGRYRTGGGGLFEFPAAYDGDYLYVDYYEGTIRRMDWNGSTFAAPVVWGTAASFTGITDCVQAADGALYYCKPASGAVRRIKSTTNLPTVSVVSGNLQAVNATWTFFAPLRVQVMQSGAPLAGAAVTFASTTGNIVLPAQPVFTDAGGFAEVTPSLGLIPTTNPTITATTPGGNTVGFTAIWRGITVLYNGGANFIQTVVRHSQNNSPVTLALDAQFASPLLTTPWGNLWTSVLAPLPTFAAFDGLGAVGPPDPAVKTAAAGAPNYVLTLFNLPVLGGVQLSIQAYAFDTSKANDEFYMISNKVNVTLN